MILISIIQVLHSCEILRAVGSLFTNVPAAGMVTISVTPAVQDDFGLMNNFEKFVYLAVVLVAISLIPHTKKTDLKQALASLFSESYEGFQNRRKKNWKVSAFY
jgi:hypothetical protein